MKKASSRHPNTAQRALRLCVGHHRRRPHESFAVAAARSTISAATANRATARSTRRRSACVWPSTPARRGRSRIRIAAAATSTSSTTRSSAHRRRRSRLRCSISTFGDEYKVPLTYNFNLTFERELFSGLMARAAYVGSRNRNGRQTISLNYADKNIPGATTGNTDAAPPLRRRPISARSSRRCRTARRTTTRCSSR